MDPSSSAQPVYSQSSSPTQPKPIRQNTRKEKRLPSVTPRKFNRFFTPRSHGPSVSNSTRRALFDITLPVVNHGGTEPPSSPLQLVHSSLEHEDGEIILPETKKRKLSHNLNSSPDVENWSGSTFGPALDFRGDSETSDRNAYMTPPCSSPSRNFGDKARDMKAIQRGSATIQPLTRIADRGLVGQLSELRLSGGIGTGRRYLAYPTPDWHSETAGFHSRPEDSHHCPSIEDDSQTIPFCVDSCNSSTLVAVGDEDGHVRLLESAKSSWPSFKEVFLSFRAHTNAIIDLSFSPDDRRLATASGDQTAKVFDMTTQIPIAVLGRHSASLKQVKFQPNVVSNDVLATSSRDGSVQIWDLRCASSSRPVQHVQVPAEPEALLQRRAAPVIRPVDGIIDAHRSGTAIRPSQAASSTSHDTSSRGEESGRIGDVSITTISFLNNGPSHLLLTASEANSSIKLWDTRYLQATRRKTAQAISSTAQPKSHKEWRSFGINSISLSGDGTRLYALCRDNMVYAYSTAHLITGYTPELSARENWRYRKGLELQEGLGPLYGFRHSQLHATSFYIKSAIRPAKEDKSELLAVGSADGCAVIFPTDEKYINHLARRDSQSKDGATSRPTLRCSASFMAAKVEDDLPIYEYGTPLIRGHGQEVGALSWTCEGELVTVGDDFVVRCWREGSGAPDLRRGGETDGRRWGCGWAEIPSTFDDGDDE